jgi:hypothetical protein
VADAHVLSRAGRGVADGVAHLRDRSSDVTRYQVTPAKGRIARSRQVAPFPIDVNSLPHDLGKIERAIVAAAHKYVKRYDMVVKVEPTDTRTVFAGRIVCDGNVVAELTIEQLDD